VSNRSEDTLGLK